jgi:hypothetical protein
MKILRYLSMVALLSFWSISHGEVLSDRDSDGTPWCMLQGSITDSDLPALRSAIGGGCKRLLLNSNGGNVYVAMEAGRLVRNSEIPIVVPGWARCASACVLVYAGGVIRLNYGPIQIHRPYSDNADKTLSQAQGRFATMERDVRGYLRSINVSESLFDRMIRISPDRSETLSLEDLEGLGIGFRDPIYENHIDQLMARRNGLTLTEWLALKVRLRLECGDIDRPVDQDTSRRRGDCWNRMLPAAR